MKQYNDSKDLIRALRQNDPHEALESFVTDFPKNNSAEVREAFAQGIQKLSRHAGLYGDIDFMRKLHEIPDLLNDPLIQNALHSLIPAIIEVINDKIVDEYYGPWRILYAFQDFDFIINDNRVRKSIENSIGIIIEFLWEQVDDGFVSMLDKIPILTKRPDIRVNVARLCYELEYARDILSQVDEWTSKSIVAVALGRDLLNIPDSTIKREIEEYVALLDAYDSPWQIVDVIKEVPKIWGHSQIREAVERSVPRIADGIRRSRHPLRIVETLLDRKAMKWNLADPAWILQHEDINKAIRDSMDGITSDLMDYEGPPRLAFQLAIGSIDSEIDMPRVTKRNDQRAIDKIRSIVDLKGWQYVTEKMSEQLNEDASYAERLVLAMPLDLNAYFDEWYPFVGCLGLKLVPLLFPYKPKGYIAAMKIVYRIACTAKGHEWMWKEMRDELGWIEKKAGLSSGDFI